MSVLPAEDQPEQGLRDLMGLLALPGLWANRDGETVLTIMLEAVERVVPLRVGFVQVKLLADSPRFQLLRLDGTRAAPAAVHAWESAAQSWSALRVPDGRPFAAMTPQGEMQMVRLSMGYGTYGGSVWFGASVADFPSINQLALLRAAASLAVTGLQAARSNYEREQASRAKDEFLAMLGHELRNPLAPILLSLELYKRRHAAAPLPREWEIIDRQSRHLSRLVDDLLDVARITRGKVVLARQPVELGALIRRALEDKRELIAERRHTLLTDFPDGELWLAGDETRLTQVFANLITNAAKYTDPEGCIRVSLTAAAGWAQVIVADNGAGISPQLFPRLFNIFEQGRTTLDRSHGGLGIGLSLVKSFVELHGGSVSAVSDGVGCGTTFTVTLPLLSQPPVAAPPRPAPQRAPMVKRRILLVDDSPDALESTRRYLEQQGHEVVATADPHQALVLAAALQPQVAILDIGLPEMDGFQLAAALRAQLANAPPRLVALTGYGQLRDFELTRAAGFDLHLVKPVTPSELDAALAV